VDDGGFPGVAPFTEQDSAGVWIATTSGARARAPNGWLVDTVPEYQLGAREGEDPYLWTRLKGVRQLADGRVVALDEASCEIRFFDSDGVFLEHTGGRGEGPGEFPLGRTCDLVAWPGEDSLAVFDGARLSFFDDRGRFGHRLAVWPGHRVGRVVGVARGSVLVENRLLVTAHRGGVPREPSTVDFALLEFDQQLAVWESSFLGTQTYTFLIPGNALPVSYLIPFDIPPNAAMGTGGFFLTPDEQTGPEILEYDTTGRLRRVIRVAEPVLMSSPEALDKYTEFRISRRIVPNEYSARPAEYRRIAFARDRRRYDEMPIPRTIPVFSRLLADDVGWVWAELYRYDVGQPVRWLVFGPDGEGLGSVDIPPGLEVWQIGRDFVLGVWRDELEVEYVRRHALIGRG